MGPANGSNYSNHVVSFAANVTESNWLLNFTPFIFNSSDDLINSSEGISVTGTANASNISIILPYNGTFFWNYQACDVAGNCVSNKTNWTLIVDETDVGNSSTGSFTITAPGGGGSDSGSGSGSGSDSGGGSSGSGNGISPRLPSIEDSESNLFDFDIEISAAFKTIKIGEKVQVLFTLFPFGDNFREDVVMNYYIKNSRGEVVFTEMETFIIQISKQYKKEFDVSELPADSYVFVADLEYSGGTVSSSNEFRILIPEEVQRRRLFGFLIAIGIILFLLLFLVVVLILKNWKKKRRRKGRKRRKRVVRRKHKHRKMGGKRK
jgi:hypothetical protein